MYTLYIRKKQLKVQISGRINGRNILRLLTKIALLENEQKNRAGPPPLINNAFFPQ